MCWQCDNPNGTIEEYLDGLRATIDDHGWAVQSVQSDKRPFCYTVGLHRHGLPELIITGMAAHTAARLLNSIPGGATADVGNRCWASGRRYRRRRNRTNRHVNSSTVPNFAISSAGRSGRRPCPYPPW
ncbi:DUF4262 domain-containing protein [Mycolicibacterium brisbanense]